MVQLLRGQTVKHALTAAVSYNMAYMSEMAALGDHVECLRVPFP